MNLKWFTPIFTPAASCLIAAKEHERSQRGRAATKSKQDGIAAKRRKRRKTKKGIMKEIMGLCIQIPGQEVRAE